jgi:hypothetical protein
MFVKKSYPEENKALWFDRKIHRKIHKKGKPLQKTICPIENCRYAIKAKMSDLCCQFNYVL